MSKVWKDRLVVAACLCTIIGIMAAVMLTDTYFIKTCTLSIRLTDWILAVALSGLFATPPLLATKITPKKYRPALLVLSFCIFVSFGLTLAFSYIMNKSGMTGIYWALIPRR